MYTFQYKHGDRPLEGYTIQNAAGRGGFGEVYYALSDSGREVALKVITGYEQIELRGISQCMNLKSPHLVTIFDVKYNTLGRPFVIMEYVAGPSLRQLLDEHPTGLGEQKSAFFLREIGKGLSFLHDCGIVHRDLKPGNVFYENGYVKIGDYGLSKAIATSQHSGQTVTVGTVHYMAPEIGAGKYDRGIDIYALGAVLYEMLIGVPPFVGASPSEVLLKHLSAQPDCSNIAEPYCTAIKRAMAKDPAERYQSVQEMVEAVFGTEHVRQSMSVFSPEELSVVAGRVAQQVGGGPGKGPSTPPPIPNAGATVEEQPEDRWDRFAKPFDKWGDRIASRMQDSADRIADRIAGKFDKARANASRDFTVPIEDPMSPRGRIGLALVTVAVVSIAAGILTQARGIDPVQVGVFVGTAIVGAMGGMLLMRFRLFPNLEQESRGVQRMMVGGAAALGMVVVGGSVAADGTMRAFMGHGTWIAIIVPMFRPWLSPMRRDRIQLGKAIGAAIMAFFLTIIFGGSGILAISVVGGLMLACHAMAPWKPRNGFATAAANSPNPRPIITPPPMQVYGNVNVDAAQAEQMRQAGVKVYGNLNVRLGESVPTLVGRTVPSFLRYFWFLILALSLAMSVACFIGAGNSYGTDLPIFVGLGVGLAVMSPFALIRGCSRRYFGIWNYLIRPALISASLAMSVGFAVAMGTSKYTSDLPILTFFMVFLAIVALVCLCIPGKTGLVAVAPPKVDAKENQAAPGANPTSPGPAEMAPRFQPQSHVATSLSVLSGMLLLVAMLLSIGVALELQDAILNGVFGRDFARVMRMDVFHGYDGWPTLAYHMATMLIGLLVMLAVALQIAARRTSGVLHILRGLIGTTLLFASLGKLHQSFDFSPRWAQIAALVESRQTDAAIDQFFNRFDSGKLLSANVTFITSLIFLGWPPRRREKGSAQ